MRGIAILNKDGGTFRSADLGAYADLLVEAFSAHGHALVVDRVSAAQLPDALQSAAQTPDHELMVAGGGDGTVSLAAGLAWKSGQVLGIIPAGTVNLVARSAGIPLDIEQAARALAGGRVEAVDIATANGRPFMHQFSVGLQTRLVREREKLQYGSRFGKLLASARAALAAISRPPRFTVHVDTGAEVLDYKGLSGLAVANNLYGEGHLPYADRLDGGELGLYCARAQTTQAAARLTADIMLGSWRANPDFSEKKIASAHLRFAARRRPDHALVDGELIDLSPEVEIVQHPKGVKLLVPADDAETKEGQ